MASSGIEEVESVMTAAEYSESVYQWLVQAYHWQSFAAGTTFTVMSAVYRKTIPQFAANVAYMAYQSTMFRSQQQQQTSQQQQRQETNGELHL